MSNKRQDSNDIRDLKQKVKDQGEMIEALATGYYKLAEAHNTLLARLIAKGVVEKP